MDGAKRKKKLFEFAEGHKRETRKSYQNFIESTTGTISPDGSTSGSFAADEAQHFTPQLFSHHVIGEDASEEGVRKSSRRPVPKKSFELVDVFDEESPYLKHNSARQRKVSLSQVSHVGMEMEDLMQETLEEDSAPRKSNRIPVPKKCFDLIDSSFEQGGNPQQNIKVETQEDKKQKKFKKPRNQRADIVMSGAEEHMLGEKIKNDQNEKDKEKSVYEATNEKQRQDTEKKSKLTLKLDFKAKKEKGSRKRKLTANPEKVSPHSDGKTFKNEEPREKIAKVIEDNIDQSALMEALQALKQEPQEDLSAEKIESHLEIHENVIVPEEKGRKSRSKKKPSKIKKLSTGDETIPTENIQVKQEENIDEYDKEKLNIKPTEKPWDYSSSTTEISDGHIILKLGGLNSPTKGKKHKKKHKHGHHAHKAELKNEETKIKNVEIQENSVMGRKSIQTDDQHRVLLSTENEVGANQIGLPIENKEKRVKSHKKKRKLSKEKIEDASEKVHLDTAPKEDELIVKKRKIYKKKNGEKVLARIQTEYWNKHGELVKVEPTDVKEGSQPKDKKIPKQKKTKNQKSGILTSEGQSVMQVKRDDACGESHLQSKQNKKEKLDAKPKGKKKQRKPSNIQRIKASVSKILGKNTKTIASSKKKKERKTQTLTAYLLYCRKYRPKVVSENPDIGLYLNVILLCSLID